MKKLLKGIGVVILAMVILFAGLIATFTLLRVYDRHQQRKHVEAMKVDDDASHDEQAFVSFDLGTDPRLNEIQVVATHNSYKKHPTKLGMMLVELYEKGGSHELRYGHTTLSEQFDSGVRSIELDVRSQSGRLELNHVPLVDNRATCPDFALALKEITIWSKNHPGHVPIMVLVELKSDWKELAPFMDAVDLAMLDRMDEVIRDVIPKEQLLTPDDVRQEGKTLQQSITEDGWPKLSEVQGKIMIILHAHPVLAEYHKAHESLEGCAMFTSAREEDRGSVVLLKNDPSNAVIPELVSKNYLVRTRADADLMVDEELAKVAVASGAQIISTDYPPGEPDADGYVFAFDEGKTVQINHPACRD